MEKLKRLGKPPKEDIVDISFIHNNSTLFPFSKLFDLMTT